MQFVRGNLLEADVEALVNAVNCVGVMGKGLALQFKNAFPDVFKNYARACRAGEVAPGQIHVVETRRPHGPKIVMNFPTKRHWREPSRMEDIEAGLEALVREVERRDIRSLAIPALGSGLEGLPWSEVRPRIERAFQATKGIRILVFEPL
jgi:O-acetyl-ADP-ribose deacetylase (regulator of RNase III)